MIDGNNFGTLVIKVQKYFLRIAHYLELEIV